MPAQSVVAVDGVINIVSFNGLFYRVPQALGSVDFNNLATLQALDKQGLITVHDTQVKAVVPELINASACGHVASKTTHTTTSGKETIGPGTGGGQRGKN